METFCIKLIPVPDFSIHCNRRQAVKRDAPTNQTMVRDKYFAGRQTTHQLLDLTLQ